MSMTDDIDALKVRSVELARECEALHAELDKYKASVKEQFKAVYEQLRAAVAPDDKPWWASKGMLGSYGTILGTGAMVAGYIFGWPPEAMAVLATATASSGGLAAHGRKHAEKPIRK